MKLFSYVIARDFGFAPNPFYSFCTLATCKPKIRATAAIGDWVIGTGSSNYGLRGHIVFAMCVAEILTYDQYWCDSRFLPKRPNLRGSLKQAFGDNIYHKNARTGRWVQINSHHSHADGRPNAANIRHDTQTEKVLIASEFVYWGAHGPTIPKRFMKERERHVCTVRGHKCNFHPDFVSSFMRWVQTRDARGYVGAPAEFPRELVKSNHP